MRATTNAILKIRNPVNSKFYSFGNILGEAVKPLLKVYNLDLYLMTPDGESEAKSLTSRSCQHYFIHTQDIRCWEAQM